MVLLPQRVGQGVVELLGEHGQGVFHRRPNLPGGEPRRGRVHRLDVRDEHVGHRMHDDVERFVLEHAKVGHAGTHGGKFQILPAGHGAVLLELGFGNVQHRYVGAGGRKNRSLLSAA